MGIMIPTVKCFRVKGSVQVWCPFCANWHYHGAPKGFVKGGMSLGHRISHCSTQNPFRETGYNLKFATKKEIKEIAKSLEYYL